MTKSETIAKLATALLAAQKDMGTASKDAKNPYFKSSYANLNSVNEAAIPVLNKHGISVSQPPVTIDGKPFIETILMHESGEFIGSYTEVVCAKQNDPQSYGSALSYARRYGLSATVALSTEDDDGEAAMGRTTNPTKTTAPTNSTSNGNGFGSFRKT